MRFILGVREVCGRCTEGAWEVRGRFNANDFIGCGGGPLANEIHFRCMEGVWEVHRRCMGGAQKVHGRCTGGARELCGRCTEGVMPMISLAVVGTFSQ